MRKKKQFLFIEEMQKITIRQTLVYIGGDDLKLLTTKSKVGSWTRS